MPAQSGDEGAGERVPEFDAVIKGGGGEEEGAGGECDVVDGFLVAGEAGEGFDCFMLLGLLG